MIAKLLSPALVLCLSLAACLDKGDGGDGDDDDDVATDDTGDTGPGYDPDLDHDGYPASEDCDDENYQVNPGETELCDGVDNDCDGESDEGWDADGDGYLPVDTCPTGDDCDDEDPDTHPGAEEVPYDGVDQDCDGEDVDDVDGDGFRGAEAGGNDCDDNDAEVHPGATEIAKDGIDQDCDGEDDNDGDGDGYDDEAMGGDDCDDTDPGVHPGALDWMNDGVDQDCDGPDGARMEVGDAPVTIDGDAATRNNLYVGDSLAACDLDGDGLDDLVVPAPLASSYAGQIGVFLGSGSDSWTAAMSIEDADILIAGADYFLGFGLACDDLDGDGVMDLAAGRGAFDGPRWGIATDFGIVIWYGDSSGWPTELSDAAADAELTYDLGVTQDDGYIYDRGFQSGDVDGDGAAELLVNMLIDANYDESAQLGDSSLWIIPGARYSGTLHMDEQVAVRVSSDTEDSITDYGVVDDLNGDGSPELYVAQGIRWVYDESTEEYTFPGSFDLLSGMPAADGTVDELAWASIDGLDDEALGYRAVLGDLDGDGTTDALIGQILEDWGGAEDAGAIYRVDDLATTLAGTGLSMADLSSADLQGQWQDGLLGYWMTWVGDVDGDGTGEVLVAEPGGSASGYGRVRLVSGALVAGSDTDPEDVELLEWKPESTDNDGLGGAMAGGDFDGDGYPDMALAARCWNYDSAGYCTGRVYVYLTGGLGG